MLGEIGLEKIPAILRAGDIEAAGHVHADRLLGNRFDLFIELNGVGLQERHACVAIMGVEAARRMPARPGRQLLALQQHHVAPAKFGQVIEDAAPNNPPADHGDLAMRLHPNRLPIQATRPLAPHSHIHGAPVTCKDLGAKGKNLGVGEDGDGSCATFGCFFVQVLYIFIDKRVRRLGVWKGPVPPRN